MMHPDTTATLAHQHLAEVADELRHHVGAARGRPLRVRAGRVLVRWGTRLAVPAPRPARLHRSATMSA